MARRSGFVGLMNQIAREQARAQRRSVSEHNRQIREYNRMIREQEKHQKQLIREQKQYEKDLRQQYLEDRQLETDELNQELNNKISELDSILSYTLSVDDNIAFDSLRIKNNFQPLQIPKDLQLPKSQPEKKSFERQTVIKPVGFLERIFHGENGKNNRILTQQQDDAQASEKAYQNALNYWQKSERERIARIEKLKAEHEEAKQNFISKMNQRNADVDELETAYKDGDSEAIVTYNVMVLERSEYPEDFPQEFRLAYVPDSKELVIDYELPTIEVIPTELEYKFLKTKDEIQTKLRKPAEIKSSYQDVVASVCLRTIHEVLEADQGNHLSVITFNGFVQTVDRTTGRDIRPYLTSVRVTKDRFLEIDLGRIDKKACLRNLGAQVSPQPEECVPVKPIVDFNMVDKRFVEGSDVLSELDARPNLMELNPFEFENLVGNLFTQMGLDTRQTQTSRDGGVDAIAFDSRPVLGGKIVIQAKRYKNTVGVASVRDLYGTMINEGASKGILVATSGYGKDAFEFAKDKPIELIDGGGLLYLLEQHANIKAKIIIPKE
ncbi:MAG: restriction endonuclease [Pyrinomonadaceae bacterium]|nr:restriction endonuclease [Pyrinomonadaceae bacterium]